MNWTAPKYNNAKSSTKIFKVQPPAKYWPLFNTALWGRSKAFGWN